MRHLAIALGLAGALAAPPARADRPVDRPPLELQDGDRVVLVGDALIERMQEYGYLETLLIAAHPDKTITFRNLGWSGDTVFGEARAGFGTPEDGFKALVAQVNAAEPTVLIVGYGANESWDGEAGLPRFREGYDRLLDALEATGAREIVLLSPIAQRGPLPNPATLPRSFPIMKLYAEEIGRIADERGHRFIDVLTMTLYQFVLGNLDPAANYTSEGVHLSEYGYEQLARRVVLWGVPVMGPDQRPSMVRHFATRREPEPMPTAVGDEVDITTSGTVTNATAVPDGLQFEFTPSRLPTDGDGVGRMAGGTIFVDGLPAGRYRVRCDGRPLPEGLGGVTGGVNGHTTYAFPDGRTTSGITVVPGSFVADPTAGLERFEVLRRAIVKKNELYFHRYRPQNETYLFGFRKHEQGNNAAEVEEFDRLVAEAEAEIARLKVPQPSVYELERIDEEDADR